MKTSSDRILTTHVGSLPRDAAVVDLLFRRSRVSLMTSGFRPRSQAVDDGPAAGGVGLDVVSDGETSKIGYATYIKDRLSGFDGEIPVRRSRLATYPDFRARWPSSPASRLQAAVLYRAIRFAGHADVQRCRALRDAA